MRSGQYSSARAEDQPGLHEPHAQISNDCRFGAASFCERRGKADLRRSAFALRPLQRRALRQTLTTRARISPPLIGEGWRD